MNVTSLTSFISEDETLLLLNANFSNPIKRTGATLLIEPAKGKGVDFGAIGTAYDYWLRCALKKSDPSIFKTFLGHQKYLSRYSGDSNVAKLLKRHTKAFVDFSKGLLETNELLLEACLFIAKFETEYRSGYPIETFDVTPQNIEELGRVAAGTRLDFFLKKKILLNPIFAVKGSRLAIQADGDIVVDAVLVDLKTSSQITLKDNLRQLIGYWALNMLNGDPKDVSRLGVYYPRFNYLVDFLPEDLMTALQRLH